MCAMSCNNQPTIEQSGDATSVGKTPWVSVVSGSQLTAKGKPLRFVSPVLKDGKPVASLLKHELETAAAHWLHSIVLYVVGYSPTIANVHRYIARDWNFVSKPTVFYHDGW